MDFVLCHLVEVGGEVGLTIATSVTTSVTTSPPSVLNPETIALLEQLGHRLNAIGSLLSPYLGMICIVVAWLTLFAVVSNAIAGIAAAVRRLRTMHRIPCSRCAFFTNDYRLKCSVDPIVAGSEAAIDCPHYEPCGDAYRSGHVDNSENLI